jgi:hypothetical protein
MAQSARPKTAVDRMGLNFKFIRCLAQFPEWYCPLHTEQKRST